jgi:hypothetical protein
MVMPDYIIINMSDYIPSTFAGLLWQRHFNQKNIAMILLPAINCTPVKAKTI